jgi:hypothetical protein
MLYRVVLLAELEVARKRHQPAAPPALPVLVCSCDPLLLHHTLVSVAVKQVQLTETILPNSIN